MGIWLHFPFFSSVTYQHLWLGSSQDLRRCWKGAAWARRRWCSAWRDLVSSQLPSASQCSPGPSPSGRWRWSRIWRRSPAQHKKREWRRQRHRQLAQAAVFKWRRRGGRDRRPPTCGGELPIIPRKSGCCPPCPSALPLTGAKIDRGPPLSRAIASTPVAPTHPLLMHTRSTVWGESLVVGCGSLPITILIVRTWKRAWGPCVFSVVAITFLLHLANALRNIFVFEDLMVVKN